MCKHSLGLCIGRLEGKGLFLKAGDVFKKEMRFLVEGVLGEPPFAAAWEAATSLWLTRAESKPCMNLLSSSSNPKWPC